jgi:hypothetical protein
MAEDQGSLVLWGRCHEEVGAPRAVADPNAAQFRILEAIRQFLHQAALRIRTPGGRLSREQRPLQARSNGYG